MSRVGDKYLGRWATDYYISSPWLDILVKNIIGIKLAFIIILKVQSNTIIVNLLK